MPRLADDRGLELDLNALIDAGLLVPGARRRGGISWPRLGGFGDRAEISFHADLIDPRAAWLVVQYTVIDLVTGRRRHFDYRIRLVTTTPHYGGLRWWFVCPLTARRCARLYLPDGGEIFACRGAACIVCPTTARAGGETSPRPLATRIVPFPERPKGMWWRTYHETRRRLVATAAAQPIGIDQWLAERAHEPAVRARRGRRARTPDSEADPTA